LSGEKVTQTGTILMFIHIIAKTKYYKIKIEKYVGSDQHYYSALFNIVRRSA